MKYVLCVILILLSNELKSGEQRAKFNDTCQNCCHPKLKVNKTLLLESFNHILDTIHVKQLVLESGNFKRFRGNNFAGFCYIGKHNQLKKINLSNGENVAEYCCETACLIHYIHWMRVNKNNFKKYNSNPDYMKLVNSIKI